MKIVIDRFEGEYAVCEMPDSTMVNIPKIVLEGASEGDIININIDKAETDKRKENIEKLMNDVWAD